VRIDRVFKFKVLKALKGKVCEVRATSIRGQAVQVTRSRFDCYGSGVPRWQWIHKDERESHGQLSDVRSYSTPTTPICVDDCAEVGITIISLMGVTEVDSLEWHALKLEKIPD